MDFGNGNISFGHPDNYFERFLLIIQLYFQIVYPVSLFRTLPLQLSLLTSEDHIIVLYRFLYSLYVYFPQRIQRMTYQIFLYLHQTEFFHCVISVFSYSFFHKVSQNFASDLDHK